MELIGPGTTVEILTSQLTKNNMKYKNTGNSIECGVEGRPKRTSQCSTSSAQITATLDGHMSRMMTRTVQTLLPVRYIAGIGSPALDSSSRTPCMPGTTSLVQEQGPCGSTTGLVMLENVIMPPRVSLPCIGSDRHGDPATSPASSPEVDQHPSPASPYFHKKPSDVTFVEYRIMVIALISKRQSDSGADWRVLLSRPRCAHMFVKGHLFLRSYKC
ncbi:hypothetical protein LIA77_00765 [Sarocladium implicatum]|nr:hypothetical protein LIA77_00765 [Sarocladium implicatum]